MACLVVDLFDGLLVCWCARSLLGVPVGLVYVWFVCLPMCLFVCLRCFFLLLACLFVGLLVGLSVQYYIACVGMLIACWFVWW